MKPDELIAFWIMGLIGLFAATYVVSVAFERWSAWVDRREAVKASGRDIPLITRSWLARKSQVVPLAKGSSDFTVEIKFNGEQWGAPYMLMGGRMAGWYSYSFEDYFSDSQVPDAARLWPGSAIAGGGQWPSEPYKIVWQVRANGTHHR